MHKIVQTAYSAPSKHRALRNERLVIHQRSDQSEATHVAIFVHGLGGSRYGDNSTWGDFPKLIFEDFPTVDIGMYYYRSLFRRLAFWRSIRLDEEAIVLADAIRSLNYHSIILLGHSMGGLLCKGTVAHLAATNQRDPIGKVTGMFFLASPQLGSKKAPSLLAWLTKDSRALELHGQYVTNVEAIFREHIHSALSFCLDEKYQIPCWALVGSDDCLVDALSAGIGLTANQRLTLGCDHWTIVKPHSRDDEGYRFVSSAMKHAIAKGNKPRRRHECRPARLEDLRTINELATRLFGQDVSSLESMRAWREKNQDVFWILRRITSSPGGYRNEEVVGYFCVIPIGHEARVQLRNGQIKISDLPSDSVLESHKPAEAVYVGGIAGTDLHSKANILIALTTHLQDLAKSRNLEILTRPVTEDGLRVVENHEMTPVSDEGLGHLYESTISGA